MRGLIITFITVFLLARTGYSQKVEEYTLQNIDINDSDNNEGVSFYKQNYLIYTLPKKEKNLHDTDFYVSLASESGTVLEGSLMEGNINSYINEIDLVFTTDFKKVFFTRSYIGNNKKEHFDIYIADVTEENQFVNIKSLPINYKNYSTAYPCLSLDNKTLYFASNRRESLGGFDIFKVAILENGRRFGKVTNLGDKVNTKGNEITPFVLSNQLYFSSDGRGGFGKLDVFSFDLDLKENAKNLGETLNSNGNDFDYIRKEYRNYGFLSSDRENGKGENDIYYFKAVEVDPPIVEVVEEKVTKVEEVKKIENEDVANKELIKEPLNEVKIVEDTVNPIKEQVVLDEKNVNSITDKNNSLVKQEEIEAEKTNKVLKDDPATKIIESEYVTEILYEEKQEVAENIYDFQRRVAYNTTMEETGRILKKRLKFTKQEKRCVDNIRQLDDIYFNLNKFNIRPDAQIQVNKAIKIMEKCPNINFVASSYTDSRGSSVYNAKLSQRRATSVVTYILNNSSISIDRIAGVGYGESGLKNKCYNGVKCSEKKHQENRRTEIEVYIYE